MNIEYNADRENFHNSHGRVCRLIYNHRKPPNIVEQNEARTVIAEMDKQAATLRSLQQKIFGAFNLVESGYKGLQSQDYFEEMVKSVVETFSLYGQQVSF